jgi:hypothetical protein
MHLIPIPKSGIIFSAGPYFLKKGSKFQVRRGDIHQFFQVGENKEIVKLNDTVLLSNSLRRKFCSVFSLNQDDFTLHVKDNQCISFATLELKCHDHRAAVGGMKVLFKDVNEKLDDELIDVSLWANKNHGLCSCLYSCTLNFILFNLLFNSRLFIF